MEVGDVCIDPGGLEAAMPRVLLDLLQVYARFHQVRSPAIRGVNSTMSECLYCSPAIGSLAFHILEATGFLNQF